MEFYDFLNRPIGMNSFLNLNGYSRPPDGALATQAQDRQKSSCEVLRRR